VARLDADIARVTEDPDPLAERGRLASREAKLAGALQRSRDTATERARELAVAEAQREASERAAMAATRAADDSRARADAAARTAGFADEAAVRAAALDAGAIEALAREVQQFREHRHAQERRAEELTRELAGREVDETAVREAEASVEARDRACTTIEREKAQLELEIRRLRERLDRTGTIRRDLAVARTDLRVAAQLAEDLKSANFQAFVLEETFRELAAGASERLRALSGRYTLEYRDRTFAVIDHDNAGERRSADTLSGGETFLASLALALELSAQVQRAAGAVSLDSLFVDEGFGTLDAGTLDAAASAIESLPVAGRMVGIVTHVPELAERLPARVIVDKRGDGSRVRIETA
jgi:exonuclease SbcC